MKYIKNGKLVLDGTMRECDLQDKLNKALEIIVDKKVHIERIKVTKNAQEYNKTYLLGIVDLISQKEFKIVKEIIG